MVLLAAVLGIAVGVAASLLFTAFIPLCGDPCGAEGLMTLLLCTAGAVAVFVGAAVFLLRRRSASPRLFVATGAAISVLMLAPAAAYYVYALHGEYRRLEAAAPVRVTTDFFHMAIATRAVTAFSDASGQSVKPVIEIPQWQRCLIGVERCETQPRQVEMLCKTGVVNVNEADWPAFSLIPQENAAGISPLKSMRLCGG